MKYYNKIPCKSNPMPYYTGFIPYENRAFTIEAVQNTSVTFSSNNASNIKYSKNDGQTTGYCGSSISLNAGDTVSFVGTSGYSGKIANFSYGNGTFKMYGNIASLIGWSDTIEQQNFNQLFSSCSKVVDIQNLIIGPRTVKRQGCYGMFRYCQNFKTPCKIKSTDVYFQAFAWLFAQNSSNSCQLTAAVEIPPLTGEVGGRAFASAHDYNRNIVAANFCLPSGCTLGGGVYEGFLWTCTGLKKSPIFGNAATNHSIAKPTNYTNGSGAYYNFSNNDNSSTGRGIQAIEVQFTSWGNKSTGSASGETYQWFKGAGSTGIFIKPAQLELWYGSNGDYGIPNSGWTVLNRHSDGTLWYVNSNNQETGQYNDPDPYAWYWENHRS